MQRGDDSIPVFFNLSWSDTKQNFETEIVL